MTQHRRIDFVYHNYLKMLFGCFVNQSTGENGTILECDKNHKIA